MPLADGKLNLAPVGVAFHFTTLRRKISSEMDRISFRISLQKDPIFVITFVLLKKNSCISHSLTRISQNFVKFCGIELPETSIYSNSRRAVYGK